MTLTPRHPLGSKVRIKDTLIHGYLLPRPVQVPLLRWPLNKEARIVNDKLSTRFGLRYTDGHVSYQPADSTIQISFLRSKVVPMYLIRPLLHLRRRLVDRSILLQSLLLGTSPVSTLAYATISPQNIGLRHFV